MSLISPISTVSRYRWRSIHFTDSAIFISVSLLHSASFKSPKRS